ncbi:MAG: B12-binding domain-containing radical SAM protein [Nitrospirota bacterium]|nr:B12-binding domain-containing radical SAM protein [Nitrospirota bacterium]
MKDERTVLLINPCYDKSDMLGPFARYISSQLPLSLGLLAGYLLERGIPVEIVDEQLRQADGQHLRALLDTGAVRVVGISVLTLTSARAYELGALIKRLWPQITVVMGGVHVTLLPEEPLARGAADIVVRNEGEVTFYEIVSRIHAGSPYGDVVGVSYVREGKVVHNPERTPVDELDKLPVFPYHLFEENSARYQFGNMLTSRGCPYECIFCSQRAISGRRYRVQSPERTFRELERLVFHYGQRFIFINDDNFLVQPQKVRRLCELIIRRGFPDDVRIGFNGRGDSLDPDLLRDMRAARFSFILIGFETGSERLMSMVKKGETVSQIAEGVRVAKEAGFTVGGQFILGFPTETRRESFRTIWHALRLPIDFVRFNLLVPYPGTEVHAMVRREKDRLAHDWTGYATHGGLTGKGAPYVPEGRSARELVSLQWIGHLLFYLRPRQLLNMGNMRYATGGQVMVPETTSLRGCLEFLGFAFQLLMYLVVGAVRSKKR